MNQTELYQKAVLAEIKHHAMGLIRGGCRLSLVAIYTRAVLSCELIQEPQKAWWISNRVIALVAEHQTGLPEYASTSIEHSGTVSLEEAV